ncbi:MAG: hypothetical protein PSX81_03380 [bacterium]|nr:hypothetical protein [bacterium]
MKQFFKTVLAGFLAGVALFILPFFLVRVFVFFLLVGAIFKLMGGRRRGMHYRYAFAQKFRNMSEDDRNAFMQKHGNRCGYYNEQVNNNNENNQ